MEINFKKGAQKRTELLSHDLVYKRPGAEMSFTPASTRAILGLVPFRPGDAVPQPRPPALQLSITRTLRASSTTHAFPTF